MKKNKIALIGGILLVVGCAIGIISAIWDMTYWVVALGDIFAVEFTDDWVFGYLEIILAISSLIVLIAECIVLMVFGGRVIGFSRKNTVKEHKGFTIATTVIAFVTTFTAIANSQYFLFPFFLASAILLWIAISKQDVVVVDNNLSSTYSSNNVGVDSDVHNVNNTVNENNGNEEANEDTVDNVSKQIDLLTELRDKNVIDDKECAEKVATLLNDAGIELTESKKGEDDESK